VVSCLPGCFSRPQHVAITRGGPVSRLVPKRTVSRGIVKLPQDLGTVALRVVLTVAPDRNLLGLCDQRLRQLDNTGVGYLAAPILALIGEWDLARGADREAAADLPFEQKKQSVFTDLSPWVEGSESAPSLETIGSDARGSVLSLVEK